MTLPSPQIGSLVRPDEWRNAHRLVESDWSEAPFRLPTGRMMPWADEVREVRLAVRVEVTGRTVRRPFGRYGGRWVRVRVTFVGDGEPDTHTGGWMAVE